MIGRSTAILFVAWCSGFGTATAQYQPIPHTTNIELPGEQFIELVVPRYSIKQTPLTGVFRDLARRFGVRFGIEVSVRGPFREPVVSVDLTGVTFKDLLNKIVRDSGFKEAVWLVDTRDADSFHVRLGPTSDRNPLFYRVSDWSAPDNVTPGNAILSILLQIPDLAKRFYPHGIAGSRSPYVTSGCRAVYQTKDETVGAIVKALSRIEGVSWMFVYVTDDEPQSRMSIF